VATVLITGGAGFIGCRLAARLLAGGDEVWVADNLHPQVHHGDGLPPDLPAAARFVPLDVTHEASWRALARSCRPDVVVHLAAETGTGQSLREATRHASVNVVGTTAMLDAFMAAGHAPSQVVLASSRAVYGEGRWITAAGDHFYPSARSHDQLVAGQWDAVAPDGTQATALASEAGVTEPRPANVYAATKLAQEHVLDAWCAATGSALTVLRLQNVYGPGQALANAYTGVLAFFGQLAVKREPIPVYEDGAIVRDFVFVDDVVAAMTAAIAARPAGTTRVDIGSGTPSTILDVARLLAQLTGGPEPVVTGLFRDGDVRAASCATAGAQRLLGYETQWPLVRGLRALVEWIEATGPVR
jgi:dTDP-L-rhamnose 4-epimerase